MKSDQLNKIVAYRKTMQYMKKLLEAGVITSKDYERVDRIMSKKYDLSLSVIYRI